MDLLTKPVLVVHILAGGLSLLAGLSAIGSQKGGRWHKQSGMLYYWGMWTVFLTALYLSIAEQNYFLFMVGFFSFYFVWIGRRMLRFKRFDGNPDFGKTERTVSQGVLVVCASLALYGGYELFWLGEWMGLVAILLSYGGATFARRMIYLTLHEPERELFWLYAHIVGMGGGYIATVTAFLVVNLTMVPTVYRWLIPLVVGTLAIQRTISAYRKKEEASMEKQP
jgi:hypothetical protein